MKNSDPILICRITIFLLSPECWKSGPHVFGWDYVYDIQISSGNSQLLAEAKGNDYHTGPRFDWPLIILAGFFVCAI